MKRKGTVINRKAYRVGRNMATWAASGMNWAEGPGRDELMAKGRQLLVGRHPALERLGKAFLAAEAAWERDPKAEGEFAPCWWQTGATRIIEEFQHNA